MPPCQPLLVTLNKIDSLGKRNLFSRDLFATYFPKKSDNKTLSVCFWFAEEFRLNLQGSSNNNGGESAKLLPFEADKWTTDRRSHDPLSVIFLNCVDTNRSHKSQTLARLGKIKEQPDKSERQWSVREWWNLLFDQVSDGKMFLSPV